MPRIEVSLKTIDEGNVIDFKYSTDKEDNLGSDDLAFAALKMFNASDFTLEHILKDLIQNAIDFEGFDFKKAFEVKE